MTTLDRDLNEKALDAAVESFGDFFDDYVSDSTYPALRAAITAYLDALSSLPAQAVGVTDHTFAEYEGVTAKELAETVARYGKALSQIDRSWAAAVSGASTDIPNITGWTGALDNYGQIFAWVARAALRSTP